MGVVLSRPGVYLPPTVLTNKDLVELVDEKTNKRVLDTTEADIERLTGIRERRISLDKDVVSMGIEAAKDLEDILGRKVDPEQVIFATNDHRRGEFPLNNDGEFPNYAGGVSTALGRTKGVTLMDLLAGCTGLVYAIDLAHSVIKSGKKDRVVVAGAERLSGFTDYSDRNTCPLFGDAAGVHLLERRDDCEGIVSTFSSGIPDTQGYLKSERKLGKKLRQREDGRFIAYDAVDEYVVMNGRRVFMFATRAIVEAAEEVLRVSPYNFSDVRVIVPHGANIRIIDPPKEDGKERFSPKEEFIKRGFKGVLYTNMCVTGNTSTASTAVSTARAIEEGIIKDGDLVMTVSFGAGLTCGAILYRAHIEEKVRTAT